MKLKYKKTIHFITHQSHTQRLTVNGFKVSQQTHQKHPFQ